MFGILVDNHSKSVTIEPERVFSMSAVILICGSNFCAIAGDSRLMRYQGGNETVESNKFRKVFKPNKNVIYGVTGFFSEEESLAPFKNKRITDRNFFIEDAVVAVQKHRKKSESLPPQTFLLAGKSREGKFAAAVLSYKRGETECSPDLAVPTGGQYWLRFSVPRVPVGQASEIVSRKIESTMPYPSLDVLSSHMKNAVKEISKIEKTVNTNIDVETVT